MTWEHPQERHTWSIGPLNFMITRDNGGWIYCGWVGDEEFLPERYSEASLDDVKSFCKGWARAYLQDLTSQNDRS